MKTHFLFIKKEVIKLKPTSLITDLQDFEYFSYALYISSLVFKGLLASYSILHKFSDWIL